MVVIIKFTREALQFFLNLCEWWPQPCHGTRDTNLSTIDVRCHGGWYRLVPPKPSLKFCHTFLRNGPMDANGYTSKGKDYHYQIIPNDCIISGLSIVNQRFVDLWDDCRSKSLRWSGFKRLLTYFRKRSFTSAISSYLVYRYLRLVNSRDNPWIWFYNHFTIPWIDHEFTITMVLWFDPTRKNITMIHWVNILYRMSHWSYDFAECFFFRLIFIAWTSFNSMFLYNWWQLD